mmetsp:Transcript_15873/g.38150  ORF Transcript_15873/g.38150 Transcript_15873/m.38150 type:complete len:83 (+) Transcript_15873:67-315(+)
MNVIVIQYNIAQSQHGCSTLVPCDQTLAEQTEGSATARIAVTRHISLSGGSEGQTKVEWMHPSHANPQQSTIYTDKISWLRT